DGTATTAEGDYTPITGQDLTINPGHPLTQPVIVTVPADNTVEPADTFTLNLSNAIGRNVSMARAVATGTILNDNRATLAVSDVSLPEGSGGSTAFAFTISLSNPSEQPVSVQVDTADGTATAAEGDYAPLTGRVLTFKPGDPLTQTFMVN